MRKTFQIIVTGQVQGVGFRPFVFAVAKKFGLDGTISNNENGVLIYLTGQEETIRSFYQKLLDNPPLVSKIKGSQIIQVKFRDYKSFRIILSEKKEKLNLSLTPDFAICETCKKEIENPNNRRFGYPFTTCVHCGPRWAITSTFPFERAHTSLQHFKMCATCQEEYDNPEDRRFHSQTNSCDTCGIEFYLSDNQGGKLAISKENLFNEVTKLLSQGKIIAVKNTSMLRCK
jgi:hydrogenase maturation protein HypF